MNKAEVKKAEAAAKARIGRSSRWRPSSGTARALRAARRPARLSLFANRASTSEQTRGSREATSPNSEGKREKVSRPAGFEPTRALPKRYRVNHLYFLRMVFLVSPLNRSGTVASHVFLLNDAISAK